MPGATGEFGESEMRFFKRLLSWKRSPQVRRVRICVECGMPVGEHKTWCSIYRAVVERPALARSEK